MTVADRSASVSRSIPAATVGRYLVQPPVDGRSNLALVGFHGYGENAERHLEHLRRIPGTDAWTLCAVQALHRFYTRQNEVVGSWMTSQDREQAIRDNVRYVAAAVTAIDQEFGPFARVVFAGFSQGVAMAYRAAAALTERCDGLIVLAGDVPPDIKDAAVALPPVLLGRGTRDEWYTDEKLAADVAALRSRAVSLETVTFEGAHEWHSEFVDAAGAFLHRLRSG